MIEFEFMKNPYDGDEWENVIDSCYRLRFQKEGFTKIPANQGGDGGIEGFVKDGEIVYQCYCPEKEYSDEDLNTKLRDKVTKDIKKLLNNGDELKACGITEVKEWHFVTPGYRDKRIVKHCEKKRQEVMQAKIEKGLDYISDNFSIRIKIADDFKNEINMLSNLENFKFDIALKKPVNKEPDWDKCDSEKVENIERKLAAIIDKNKDSLSSKKYSILLNRIGNSYIDGLELLLKVQNDNSELYEKIISLSESYKSDMEFRCLMNDNSSINKQLFQEILDDFGAKLKESLGNVLNVESIAELKWDLVSSWIADCPMEFY